MNLVRIKQKIPKIKKKLLKKMKYPNYWIKTLMILRIKINQKIISKNLKLIKI